MSDAKSPLRPRLAAGVRHRPAPDDRVIASTEDGRRLTLLHDEWSLLAAMDGARSVAELTELARAAGFPATERSMISFLQELEGAGLIEGGPPPRWGRAGEQVRRQLATSMRRGEYDAAYEVFLGAHEDHRLDPELSSMGRALAALLTVRFEQGQRPQPPRVPDTLDDPRAHDARWLAQEALDRLERGLPDQASMLVQTAELLDPARPDVARAAAWLHDGADPQTSAELEITLPALPTASRERESVFAMRARRITRALMVLVAVVLVMVLLPHRLTVTEPVTMQPEVRAFVRPRIAGRVAEVRVEQGDRVEAGDVLAILERDDLVTQARVLRAKIEGLVARQHELDAGARPRQRRLSRQPVEHARVRLALARAEQERVEALHARGLASTEELDDARAAVELIERELASAQAHVRSVAAPALPEEQAALAAEQARLWAELHQVQGDLEHRVLRSPISGVVATRRPREALGRRVEPGESLLELVDFRTMEAEILLPDGELDIVGLGQPVVAKFKALPAREFEGRVEAIVPVATAAEDSSDRLVRVRVHLDNQGDLLRDHMEGWAEIDCGERSVLWVGARRLVRWLRVRLLL